MIKDLFNPKVASEVIARIQTLRCDAKPLWGKMSVDQMLAHCNVTYAFTYQTEQFKKPNPFFKFILKAFVKPMVVSEKPYPKSSRTANEFIITGTKDFEAEKKLLIANIEKTQQLGFAYFDGKENFSFGKMTGQEWNNLFYKHLDHHLAQFGV